MGRTVRHTGSREGFTAVPSERGAEDGKARPSRRVVFVAGSGRSGTSTMTGALSRLGLKVPQPEVRPDETNPRGFGEPRWAVGLHADLLMKANVHMTDGRPTAASAAAQAVDEHIHDRLRSWLLARLDDTGPELVVKDPRLVWFLDLWRSAALACDAEPSFVTMLRPVPEVVGSKQTSSSRPLGDVAATVAGWVNTMLLCERETRRSKRVFVRYHDLLSGWRDPVTQVCERCDLDLLRSAPPDLVAAVDEFIEPSLRRVRLTWSDLTVPTRLRDLAHATWRELDRLADGAEDGPDDHRRLDELRAAYMEYYTECEVVAHWTAVAARGEVSPAHRVSVHVPYRLREAVPPQARRVMRQVLGGHSAP